ncbi:type VII secretion system-associated protein [Streptomyces sp. NPDC058579]|uniref:type VII secretion system-associated protein n=1 Tax=Streptomyces sp. NPDC058579 TaxID=3346548 RepID=UPI00365C7111
MPDLTHLDSATLRTFADQDLAAFLTALAAIRKDSQGTEIRALKSILDGRTYPNTLQQNPVLGIGLMAADDAVHGLSLIANVRKAAESVDNVFADQEDLFEDIDRNLRETLRTLLNTQGSSLMSIDAAEFLDVFADVDDSLGGGDRETDSQREN